MDSSLNLSDKGYYQLNILITQSHRACLADFGLATTKDSQSFHVTPAVNTRVKGSLRWQAPELMDPDADDASSGTTLASDVYAFAFVCYEVVYMITTKGSTPFLTV